MSCFRVSHFITILFLLISWVQFLNCQELPPVEIFTPKEYGADNQNWSIAQSKDKTIFIANNKGLLEYDGARWQLHFTDNQTIVRSVAVIDEKIYTGSYMDFGFWLRDEYGKLNYTSLSNDLEIQLLEDEEFWTIVSLDDWMLFQSLDRIYIVNLETNKTKIIESGERITKMFRVDNDIYFQRLNKGIYKIENGEDSLVTNSPEIRGKEVINIFDSAGSLLIHTRESGFFKFSKGELIKWQIASDSLLSSLSAYSSIRLRNGNYIIGTISDGLIKIDNSGNFLFNMNQSNGLSNNTVLSVFQDISGNIWAGADNGISVLNLDSPYRVYNDKNGKLGTVYTSIKANQNLYLGTNQGLFYRPLKSKGDFNLVRGTEGQVWVLRLIDGILLCGHDKGTFQISGAESKLISSEKGTWDIMKIPGKDDYLIQGNYRGLSILQKRNNAWVYAHKVEGYDISSRYFEFVDKETLLVSHEYKGVYKLKFNNRFTTIIDVKKEPIKKGIASSVFKYNSNVYYASADGLFKFTDNTFVKDSILLSEYFKYDNYVSGKLIYDDARERLWGFFKEQIVYLEPGNLSNKPMVNTIDLNSDLRKIKTGFENILHLKDNIYLLGTTNGYLTIDLDRFREISYDITIDGISNNSIGQEINPIVLDEELHEFKSEQNNIGFTYSVPNYSSLHNSKYQYRLKGIYDNWSSWSTNDHILFENLPHGDYTFEVRAKVGNEVTKNIASTNFSIAKSWYLKPFAIFCYCLFFLLIVLLVQYFNKKYFKRQQAKLLEEKERELEYKELENKRSLAEFKNKSLQLDIENKNRELGISTMNLIRKNEFLNNIKKELSSIKDTDQIQAVVKIIDKNINNSEDWKFFEEAFNNADKDFLKKIKSKHPSLTPNDLKLCAYLRLNLTSKEIAPLLNISNRSVEVKRYRLRKKMELPHEASLTNYILEI